MGFKSLDDCLEYAIGLSCECHYTQHDKGGKPYIFHPLRVMYNVESKSEKIVAILHDILEDTKTSSVELESNLPEVLVTAICCLTKDQHTDYKTYIGCIKFNPIATNVKIADLCDNLDLTRLDFISEKDLKRSNKYLASLRELEKTKTTQQPIIQYIRDYYSSVDDYDIEFWEN